MFCISYIAYYLQLSPYLEYCKWIEEHARRFPNFPTPIICRDLCGFLAHSLLNSIRGLTAQIRDLAALCSSICQQLHKDSETLLNGVLRFLADGKLNDAYDLIATGSSLDEIQSRFFIFYRFFMQNVVV